MEKAKNLLDEYMGMPPYYQANASLDNRARDAEAENLA